MNKLIWNEFENGFECSCCARVYGKEELSRAFGYSSKIRKEHFHPTHCMDCGVLWEEVELEGYDE